MIGIENAVRNVPVYKEVLLFRGFSVSTRLSSSETHPEAQLDDLLGKLWGKQTYLASQGRALKD